MSQTAIIQRKITFSQDPGQPVTTGDVEDMVMIFDATISEQHAFTIAITDNPVETGVSMADHAYAKPDTLVMEVVVSDTPLLVPTASDPPGTHGVIDLASSQGLLYAGNVRRSVKAWDKILQVAKSFQVFTVQTGLRAYTNMMFESGSAEQKVDSAGILRATINLRQVTFAGTATVIYPPRAPDKPKRKAKAPDDAGNKPAEEPTSAQAKPISIGAAALGVTPEMLEAPVNLRPIP
jgi:hypothetical protein